MDSHIAYLLVDGMEPYMDSCIDEHLTILLLKQSSHFEIKTRKDSRCYDTCTELSKHGVVSNCPWVMVGGLNLYNLVNESVAWR